SPPSPASGGSIQPVTDRPGPPTTAITNHVPPTTRLEPDGSRGRQDKRNQPGIRGSVGTPLGVVRSMLIVVLLVMLPGAYYLTRPMERDRVLRAALRRYRQFRPIVEELQFEPGAFGDALRERTPIIVATPALSMLTAGIFLLMLFGPGHFSDPETLASWGGSWGPLTTNRQWWRLLTPMFVHPGLLPFLANHVRVGQPRV